MTNTISKFTFNAHELRTVEIDGAPWFPAVDLCQCLGLSLNGGAHQHVKKLRTEQRRTVKKRECEGLRDQAPSLHLLFSHSQGAISLVNESGMYRLILRADTALAEPFQHWVEDEVLPAIRRTGGYLLNEQAREVAHADTRKEMPLPAIRFK